MPNGTDVSRTTTNRTQPEEITQYIRNIPIQDYHNILKNEENILFYIQIFLGLIGFFTIALIILIVFITCTRRNEYAQGKKSVNQDISLQEKNVDTQIYGDIAYGKSYPNELYGSCYQ